MVTPAREELGRWLLRHEREVDASIEPGGPVELAERILRRLSPGVTALVTTSGYRALIARALHLSRDQHPFLDGVQLGNADVYVEGPRVLGGGQIDDALVAFIAQLIALLSVFIGDDLTGNLIRAAWPDAPRRQMAPDRGGTDGR